MGLSSGYRLGPYEIVAPVGAGGMGEVYRARDTRLDRTVAIKVLNASLTATPDGKARFEREARTISQLNHPHICTLYDVGHQDDTDYLVMELLEGESLADRLKRGALPLKEIVSIGCDIADALDRAHRAGIIHRDLKPGNVMLTKSGAKLLDFGLAKPAVVGAAASSGAAPLLSAAMTLTSPSPQASPLTQQGALVGTVQYMSPEQIQGIEADARSDIFALGAMLYEMATGQRAFQGKSQIKVASAILEDEPPPVSAVTPTAPGSLERLIRTCLEKNPEDRFQSAADVKIALSWIDDREAQGSGPAKTEARWGVWIAIAAAALLAVSTSYFALQALKPEPVFHVSVLPPEGTTFATTGVGVGVPTISPDGSKLAFVAQDERGAVMLYVRALNSATAQPMAGTQNASFPFWAPDSRNLGFFAEGKLKRLDTTGGTSTTIADAPQGRGGTWSQDGTIVYSPGAATPLMSVPAAGGTVSPATKASEPRRFPYFLPDGKHFLSYDFGTHRVYVGEAGKPQKELFENTSGAIYASGQLLFVRDGTLFAQPFSLSKLAVTGDAVPIAEHVAVNGIIGAAVFSASSSGILAFQGSGIANGWPLVWHAPDGKVLGVLSDPDAYFSPKISPDAQRVVVTIADANGGNQDLWVFDVARGTRTRLTFDGHSSYPVWTPDSKSIIYTSDRNGRSSVYRKVADNSASEELLLPDIRTAYKTVSPDGRFLVYMHTSTSGQASGWDISGVALQGDRKPFPVANSMFNEVVPVLSPDGKWLAYCSNESGHNDVYIIPFPRGGAKWQVSTTGGTQPRWRGDGRVLYFVANDRSMMAADITASESSLTMGTPHMLFQAAMQSSPLGQYDVTRDGEKFLLNAASDRLDTAPLTVITNWPEVLKK